MLVVATASPAKLRNPWRRAQQPRALGPPAPVTAPLKCALHSRRPGGTLHPPKRRTLPKQRTGRVLKDPRHSGGVRGTYEGLGRQQQPVGQVLPRGQRAAFASSHWVRERPRGRLGKPPENREGSARRRQEQHVKLATSYTITQVPEAGFLRQILGCVQFDVDPCRGPACSFRRT